MCTKRKIKEIADNLERYRLCIVGVLLENNGEHFEQYFEIMRQFKEKTASDHEFRQLFIQYYRMNVGGGLTPRQGDMFFGILFNKETNLRKILESLYDADENDQTWFLSFATKLRHTVNTKLPIYDSRIASTLVLGLPAQENNGLARNLRLKNRIEINTTLEEYFSAMFEESEIKEFLKTVRGNLKEKAQKQNLSCSEKIGLPNKLSEEKLLDSCLWALYRCMV
jgi:hypothetical protein